MFNAITPIAEFGMSALDYKADQKELEDG